MRDTVQLTAKRLSRSNRDDRDDLCFYWEGVVVDLMHARNSRSQTRGWSWCVHGTRCVFRSCCLFCLDNDNDEDGQNENENKTRNEYGAWLPGDLFPRPLTAPFREFLVSRSSVKVVWIGGNFYSFFVEKPLSLRRFHEFERWCSG
uniref:Uncharacterized protein n=1 Tax=Anopheles darlingi TaxID=43151 RepID=A0A2M4CLG8_ANODA